MTAAWNDAAERERRGLPSAKDQALNGLTPDQQILYGQLLRDRRKVREVIRAERQAAEERGTHVVETLAQLGINSSYEWRTAPIVELHLEEAELLLGKIAALRNLATTYELAGRSLAAQLAERPNPE